MILPKKVKINEITPRDGLQNINNFISTEKKLKLIDLLKDAGADNIEATSFVNPKWVPQMSDADEIVKKLSRKKDASYSVLIPNLKGFERALSSGAGEVVAFLSASEIHNKNNVNKNVDDSISDLIKIADSAGKEGVIFRANIATSFGYIPEEEIKIDRVINISKILEECGYTGITLCDTTGIADPKHVFELCTALNKSLSKAEVAVHFHRNNGIEFANVLAALTAGINIFESAVGGLGGCPFAHDAGGNIATEILVEMLEKMGICTGYSLEKIFACSVYAKNIQMEYSIEDQNQ